MTQMSRRELVDKLEQGHRLDGDPESNEPFGLVDPQQRSHDSVPMVPAEVVKQLLDDGTLARNSGTGRRYFRLAQ